MSVVKPATFDVRALARRMLWCLPALLLAGGAHALDPSPPASPAGTQAAPAKPAGPATPAPKPAAATAGKAEPAASQPGLPAGGQKPTGPTPERFVPSEKVRADFAVSFPVDI